jgi:GTP-binding protein EngB required for normal cell division
MKQLFGKKKRVYTRLGASLQPKLDLIETVRSELKTDEIEVPGIVVAGSQSSGKSSVLESLSGIQLPSGQKITTRVPLILRIEMNKSPDLKPYVLISTEANLENAEKITLDQTAFKIAEYTKKIAGDKLTVEDTPLHMKVVQNEIPSMTLIDLPGITHMSVNDVQSNIYEETLNLVKKYIANEHIIILCVVPATEDFANCEAIKCAKEVDPHGNRTIGVVTKLDMCPYDITDKLKGEYINLKLGFIGVRNKPHDESFETIKKLRKDESVYFENNYAFLEHKYWGMETLINKVVKIQAEFVDDSIPKIKKQLEDKLENLSNELQTYKSNFANDGERMGYAVEHLLSVKESFANTVESSSHFNLMFQQFATSLRKSIPDYFSEGYSVKIKEKLKENRGIMLSNFLNIQSFKVLFEESLDDKLEIHSTTLIKNSRIYVQDTLDFYINDQFKLFPSMITFLRTKAKTVVQRATADCESFIETFLTMENLIFTQSKLYTSNVNEFRKLHETRTSEQEMAISLAAYHETLLNRVSDTIPMAIHHYFVYKVINEITSNILPSLTNNLLSQHMADDPNIVQERNVRQKTFDKYSEILSLFN